MSLLTTTMFYITWERETERESVLALSSIISKEAFVLLLTLNHQQPVFSHSVFKNGNRVKEIYNKLDYRMFIYKTFHNLSPSCTWPKSPAEWLVL